MGLAISDAVWPDTVPGSLRASDLKPGWEIEGPIGTASVHHIEWRYGRNWMLIHFSNQSSWRFEYLSNGDELIWKRVG